MSNTPAPSHRRITLNPREPALAIAIDFNFTREARETRCKLLGVANVASVLLGELSQPFGAFPAGTLAALFETSEGQILHVATGAPYVEPAPKTTPVTPPAPREDGAQVIAAAVNSHDDVAAERDLWREEAAGLSEQVSKLAALRTIDAVEIEASRKRIVELEQTARDAEQTAALASLQLDAAKGRLVLAVQDRNSLSETLATERSRLEAAMLKLDRLDRESLKPAEEEPDAKSTENDTDNGS